MACMCMPCVGVAADTNRPCLPIQAVALGAALQAGVLEGSVSDVMVMDVWQAALMRALAKRQLREDTAAAQQVLGEEAVEGFGANAEGDADGFAHEEGEDAE